MYGEEDSGVPGLGGVSGLADGCRWTFGRQA